MKIFHAEQKWKICNQIPGYRRLPDMNNIEKFSIADPVFFAREYIDYLSKVLKGIDLNQIGSFIRVLTDARERGAVIYFIGNGGSAATASHFANDLAIGTNSYEKPFRAISLTDNHAVMTAISNDFGYEEVFLRQLRVLGEPGDVVVGISASGNSPNILRAFEYCKTSKIRTVALTSFDGGKMKDLADEGIHVPTAPREYGPAEDAHMMIDHLVGAYLIRLVKTGG
jgi:D-sedoheptulose 7-phosphate isomerase